MTDDRALRPDERMPLAEVGKPSILIERGRNRLIPRKSTWTPLVLWDEEWEHMLGGTDLERSGAATENMRGRATWIGDNGLVEISLSSTADDNTYWFEWRYSGDAQDDHELRRNLIDDAHFYRGIRSSLPDYSESFFGFQVFGRNINGIRVGMVADGPIVWTDSPPGRIPHQPCSAFIMDHRQFCRLPTLGGPETLARAINDRGQVIGQSMTPEGIRKAVCWVDQEIQALPILGVDGRPYDLATTQAFAINRHDQVVGSSTNSAGKAQAVRWIDDQMDILASEFENSSATAINDVGQMIGTGWRYGGDTGQFLLWSEARQCEQLNLPDGAYINPHVINKDGLIAGTTMREAFVWQDGEVVDLPILAPYEGATVKDINDRGDVAGSLEMLRFGEENETGMPEAIPCVWIRTS